MDALTLLTTRRSCRKLTLPFPNETQLQNIIQAATQVPDHGHLKPYRFVVVHHHRMDAFRQLLQEVVRQFNLGEDAMIKADKVGKMAPMILAVIAQTKEGKPEWEQEMSAASAAYAAQLSAKAQGFDSVWLTGLWVKAPLVRDAFLCQSNEKIIALMMLGSAIEHHDEPKNTEWRSFVSEF